MFPTLPVERKQEEALERIERNSIESVEGPLQLSAMKKMSCISRYSTGAQPWKVTVEKGIVM
jgi:hypothetical protein